MDCGIYGTVRRRIIGTAVFFIFVFITACAAVPPVSAQRTPARNAPPQRAPDWVTDLNSAFSPRDWVAVSASGSSQRAAESAAMNALARAFKTDVASLTQASQQFSQIVNDAVGKKSVSFDQSQNFSQDVNTSTNVRGLIGVQTDMFRAQDNTYYVNARMNRRECSATYSGMIRENTAIIDRLLSMAGPAPNTLESYASLSFAYALAQVTDNFQNILEVLDPTASGRRPGYGGANAIRTKMLECAAKITIGIRFNTEESADSTLFARAAGSFFQNMGFRINERGEGDYVLLANVRFETVEQPALVSCRYFFDAALENRNGAVLFAFTGNERKSHPRIISEARRLAVRAVENSVKEGDFASEFDVWLNSLLD